MAAPQFKAVLIATQMRSESGLTFRSKQSAVCPADPLGRRGCCEPAGKTCYLPRFHIMHHPQCFRSKIDAHVAKTLESKATLVQISSAWNSREGAPLGGINTSSWKSRRRRSTAQPQSCQPRKSRVTRWPRPSSWTGASADKQWRFAPIPISASIPDFRVHLSDTPTSQQVEGWPRISGCRRQDQCGCPVLAFFCKGGNNGRLVRRFGDDNS